MDTISSIISFIAGSLKVMANANRCQEQCTSMTNGKGADSNVRIYVWSNVGKAYKDINKRQALNRSDQ